jgi:hypothetical protein
MTETNSNNILKKKRNPPNEITIKTKKDMPNCENKKQDIEKKTIEVD